jgi:hypothetical protein
MDILRGAGEALGKRAHTSRGRCWHVHKAEIGARTLKSKHVDASRQQLASQGHYYDESKKQA